MTIKAILSGHSRGLGEALAAALLHKGVAVLGLARSPNPELARIAPNLLHEVAIDLSDTAQLGAWLGTAAMREFLADASLALLLNNAGTLQPIGPLQAQAPAHVGRAIALNVAAPLMLSAAFVAATTNCPDRRILHVSSGAARNAYAGWSVYCASKAALDHHARACGLDSSPALRISSVAPGVIDTAMQAEIRSTSAEVFPLRDRFVDLKQSGALARPADSAASLIEHLLSDQYGQEPVEDIRQR